jgi:hypothetical protein
MTAQQNVAKDVILLDEAAQRLYPMPGLGRNASLD